MKSWVNHSCTEDTSLVSLSFLAILILSISAHVTAAESTKPNVIVIVSDDHGFGDIGWNNNEARTPNLDRMAKEGLRLDRFYANPICSVTRGAMMTGLASLRTGVNNKSGLDIKYRLLPQIFGDAGYQTWMCGKWHLGGAPDSERNGPQYLPHSRGFDYFYGHLHGAIDYYKHYRKDLNQLDWQRNGKPVEEEGFTTDLLVKDAIGKIKTRDNNRPFLLYLAFNAVHGPLQAPPSINQSDAKRDRRAILVANVNYMDSAIGMLMHELEAEKLSSNTIVLFFGDNGGQLANGASNQPLRGEKGGTFEGGIRVPALIRWPGKIPSNKISQQFFCAMDILPTLCDATQVPLKLDYNLDGQSIWRALETATEQDRKAFVMGNKDVACFQPPWKLVKPAGNEAAMLFNVVDDPSESNDLASANSQIVNRMLKEIREIGDSKPAKKGENKGNTGNKKNNKGQSKE